MNFRRNRSFWPPEFEHKAISKDDRIIARSPRPHEEGPYLLSIYEYYYQNVSDLKTVLTQQCNFIDWKMGKTFLSIKFINMITWIESTGVLYFTVHSTILAEEVRTPFIDSNEFKSIRVHAGGAFAHITLWYISPWSYL